MLRHITVTYGVTVAKSRYDKVWYPGEWGAGIRGSGDKNTGKGLRGPARLFELVTQSFSRYGGLGRLRDEPKSVEVRNISLQRQQTHGRKEVDKTCDRVFFCFVSFFICFFNFICFLGDETAREENKNKKQNKTNKKENV